MNMPEGNKYNYADKYCNKCGWEITYKNWSRHLKSKGHLKNDPNNEDVQMFVESMGLNYGVISP